MPKGTPLTDAFVAEIDDPASDADFAVGTHSCAGGAITTYLRLEGTARKRIGQVLITGDFFVAPPRLVFDLEAALRITRGNVSQAAKLLGVNRTTLYSRMNHPEGKEK